MGVKIIVHKPEIWKYGNIFGDILSERNGNKLIVKMTKSIKGENIESKFIELKPQNEAETFKPLFRNSTVMVNGNIFDENNEISEYVISGSVTFD
jgi:hypothetical protein